MKRICAPVLALSAALATPALGQDGELPLGELPPQRLAAGQCALVLWTRTVQPRRVFMATSEPAAARVQADGRTLQLQRTDWSGHPSYGHPPHQTFAGEGVELTVEVELDARSGMVGGALAPSGTLRYRDARGWTVVAPVAGMAACQD